MIGVHVRRLAYAEIHIRLNLMPNAAARIMEEVNGLRTAGKTPLTDAVAQAADILEFRHKPGVVVVLTDGEETCGRSACALGKQIRKSAAELTVHVIAFRNGNFAWTGEQSILEAKCLAEQNRALRHRRDAGGTCFGVSEHPRLPGDL